MIMKSEISGGNDAFGFLLLSNSRHAERQDDDLSGLEFRLSKNTTGIRPSRSPLGGPFFLVLGIIGNDRPGDEIISAFVRWNLSPNAVK